MTERKPVFNAVRPPPPGGAGTGQAELFCTGTYSYGGRTYSLDTKRLYATYLEAEKAARRSYARGGRKTDVFSVRSVTCGTGALLGSVTRDNAGVYVALTWEGGKYI